jgi:hypothetical protein
MAQITISNELHAQVSAFKQVVEAVVEESLDDRSYVEMLLGRAMELMLAEFLGPVGPDVLMTTFHKLGVKHPPQVYGFIAEVYKLGVDMHKREELKNRFGFHPPMQPDMT